MKSRAQHFGALCPVCREPISTHEVRPLNTLAAQRGAGLRRKSSFNVSIYGNLAVRIGTNSAYNRLGRNCFDILVR